MKCLFVFQNAPLSQDYSDGGASRVTQAFRAVTQLGHDMHILRFIAAEKEQAIVSFEQNLADEDKQNYRLVKSWTDVTYSWKMPKTFSGRLEGIFKGLLYPIEFAFPEAIYLQQAFKTTVNDTRPDYILTEMLPAGAVLAIASPKVPWIHGHHDWLYRLKQLQRAERTRRLTVGHRFTDLVVRKAEERILKSSTAVIAASATEMNEIRKLGVKRCALIPATYTSVPRPAPNASPQCMRIIHLGNLQPARNIIALRAYIDQVMPHLPYDWQFVVIGTINPSSTELLDTLNEVGAEVAGFVPSLSSVLQPFDVAVVPYEYNTGERTKVAQLFNHSQVVVSTEAAVRGSPYLKSNHNCLVVSSLAEFPEILKYLAANPMARKEIGLAAKETFERELTLEAQLPKFERIIDSAINRSRAR
jgi:hypothetical protein